MPPTETDTNDSKNNIESLGIQHFLNKLGSGKFYLGPPSGNIWTVQMRLHGEYGEVGQNRLIDLYNNIENAIDNYKKAVPNKSWDMDMGSRIDRSKAVIGDVKDFFKEFEDTGNQFFLCDSVALPQWSLQSAQASAGQQMINYSGFLNVSPLKIVNRKSPSQSFSMSFIQSNWSLTDILFFPWISAISMQGLIRDKDLPELTADIIIRQYATSSPYGKLDEKNQPTDTGLIKLKEYYISEAYPQSVSFPQYSTSDTGGYKDKQMVTFNYFDMKITYNI